MSTISDFQKYLTDVEDHYNQHRAPSPVSKVNSWELKDMGGACGELNSHGYPLRIEVDCAGAPDSSSQHQDPPSPPHTNPGTPTHPVVQDLVQTMMKPPNRQRIPVWQVYSKEDFQDPRLLLPRHGSKMSKSPSSDCASNASYHDARSAASSIAGAGARIDHSSDSGDIFYTPSQSPSHTPSHFSIHSRNLTHSEGDDEGDLVLPEARLPQGPCPWTAHDPHDAGRLKQEVERLEEVMKRK